MVAEPSRAVFGCIEEQSPLHFMFGSHMPLRADTGPVQPAPRIILRFGGCFFLKFPVTYRKRNFLWDKGHSHE